MASGVQALSLRQESSANDDYEVLRIALEASTRGRAFLAEYARRNRNADTETVVAAIDRLSVQTKSDAAALATEMRSEMRALLGAIREARSRVDAADPTNRAGMLATVVELLERRIDAMIAAKTAVPFHAETQIAPSAAPLAVVPRLDEPELPIPSPLGSKTPTVSLVQQPPLPRVAIMPEVSVVESVPRASSPAQPAAEPAGPPQPKPTETKLKDVTLEPSIDERLKPFASIMALSENERLALFS